MAVLYTATSVSGYNANPPPDDGTTVSTNLITWAGIKTKVGDPLNTFASTVDTNITAAFGKTLDGATVVSTAVNYPATAADQGRLIKATASGVTVTTPDAATVTAPFMFSVLNLSTGTITLAGNATNSQTIDGATTQVIKAGSGAIIKTDGTNWFTFGLKAGQLTSVNPPYGFDAPINLQLNASVGSSLLTVAVKTNSGADPSASDPVLIPFRDSTIANGDPVWVSITSALSINTNGAGASLGTQNNVPFRLWVVAFNNAGTAVLALWHSGAGSATTVINQIDETNLASTTAISAAATSAGVFYTPNGTTLTNKAFRIIGFVTYETALGTAGTYSAAPDKVQLFGPGVNKPGHVVQRQWTNSTTAASTTSATFAALTNRTTLNISPQSAANLVRVFMNGVASVSQSSTGVLQIARGNTLVGNPTNYSFTGAANSGMILSTLDNPQTTSATTYSYQGKVTAGTLSYPPASTGIEIYLEELMA